MTLSSKKHTKKENQSSKEGQLIKSGLIPIASFLYRIYKYHFPGAVLLLLIITIFGGLLTKNGLLLILGILIFILFYFLVKWFEKQYK
jgi:hypothetical protein